MSKLSFRARALDAGKPMPIFMAEELPDLPDYSAINRAVPQMPSGMEKEEECEHHLQRAICTGLIIPTPEVSSIEDTEAYERLYKQDYKMPRQLIHMQPFAMEQDIPEYDMDSEDEKFVMAQAKKSDLTPTKFEEMMDRLEKGSGQTVVTLHEAKGLLKEDDDLIIAVYDYWLNKRLKTVVPLIPLVKTEHRFGSSANNPYVAFRRRTEKMQTRKNRKNDETSYEKMLKLKRDLSRTVTLLELVKRREKTKREYLHLSIEIFEKRYQAQDYSGQLLAEVSAIKTPRPAFAPIFSNQFGISNQNWHSKIPSIKEDNLLPRREKRQYKRRKHKTGVSGAGTPRGGYLMSTLQGSQNSLPSSEEEVEITHPDFMDTNVTDTESVFSFRRKPGCSYLSPITSGLGNWPWCSKEENGCGDTRYRYSSSAISTPRPRRIGLARRRVGRGGRVILDRIAYSSDDFWSSMDYKVLNGIPRDKSIYSSVFRPKTPPETDETQTCSVDNDLNQVDSLKNTLIIDVENVSGCLLKSFHSQLGEEGEDDEDEDGSDDCGVGVDDVHHVRGKSVKLMANTSTVETVNVSDTQAGSRLNDKENNINSDISDTKGLRYQPSDVYTFEDELEESSGRTREMKFRSCKTVKSLEKKIVDTDLNNSDGCVFISLQNKNKKLKQFSDVKQRNNNFKKIDRGNNSVNSYFDMTCPDKVIFRRNYRLGGFKKDKLKNKLGDVLKPSLPPSCFATSEIVLPELFADSSINPETENELEASDDSFAILDKLGLDEPDIGLDVESQGNVKCETGQTLNDSNSNTYQKQRLKKIKNIFDFSETDFLKYETDCDVDDLIPEIAQNDIVGSSSLFGLTPNSRFNLTNSTCLPLDSEANETVNNGVEIKEELTSQTDVKNVSTTTNNTTTVTSTTTTATKSTNYHQNITSNIENQQITLHLNQTGTTTPSAMSNISSLTSVGTILASRLNLKRDYATYQQQQQQTATTTAATTSTVPSTAAVSVHDMYALNHHNYTISGPPNYNVKRNSVDNTQKQTKQNYDDSITNAVKNTTAVNPAYITEILSSQLTRVATNRATTTLLKTNRPSTATLGFTKLSTLSGAHITHNLGHTTINHDPPNSNFFRSHQDQKQLVVNSAPVEAAVLEPMPVMKQYKDISKNIKQEGTGIVRTFRAGIGNIQLTSDRSLLVPDVGKRTVSNGPATSEYSQRKVLRQHQVQSTISAQNPTITQLVTNPNVFTIEAWKQ